MQNKYKLLHPLACLLLILITSLYSGLIVAQENSCNAVIGTGKWSNQKQTFSYYLPTDSNLLYPSSKWLPCPYSQACNPPQETMQQYCQRTYFNRDKKKTYKDYHGDEKQYKNYRCENNQVILDPSVIRYTNFSYVDNSCTSMDTALYGNLKNTIKYYTQLSLDRDGIQNFSVEQIEYNEISKQFKVILKVAGEADSVVEAFAKKHQQFLCISQQGLNGIHACKADTTENCWQPKYDASKPLTSANYPWTFFLPLGMAMNNQKIVNFLNYPPFDALDSADYMKNFTMCRWNSVLQTAGIENTFLYETIVDSHPIAAPGSGQQDILPDASKYFNNSADKRYYDTPMVALLADAGGTTSLPILVMGIDARAAWANIIGVKDLNIDPTTGKPIFKDFPYVGSYKYRVKSKTINMPWVASNHPDVTTYNCCAGDPDSKCSSQKYGNSWSLLKDESIDLISICISKKLSEQSGMKPTIARSQCKALWNWKTADPEHQKKICVQAKMDYNYTAKGQCKMLSDAENFCKYYSNNPCPTNIKPNPNLLPNPDIAKNATTNAQYYTCNIATDN